MRARARVLGLAITRQIPGGPQCVGDLSGRNLFAGLSTIEQAMCCGSFGLGDSGWEAMEQVHAAASLRAWGR